MMRPFSVFIFLLLSLISLRAELLFSESFDQGFTGWEVTEEHGKISPKSGSLEYEGVTSKGGHAVFRPEHISHESIFKYSFNHHLKNDELWCSYLIRSQEVGSSHFYMRFHRKGLFIGKATRSTRGDYFGVSNRFSRVKFQPNRTYHVVTRLTRKEGRDHLVMWVNPPAGKKPSDKNASFSTRTAIGPISSLDVSSRGSDDSIIPHYALDEIRLATRWESLENPPRRNVKVEAAIVDTQVSGPFWMTLTTSTPLYDLPKSALQVKNGQIMTIRGGHRCWNVQIRPTKKGSIQIDLPARAIKDRFGNPNEGLTTVRLTYLDNRSNKSQVTMSVAPRYTWQTVRGSDKVVQWNGENVRILANMHLSGSHIHHVAMTNLIHYLENYLVQLQKVTGQSLPIAYSPKHKILFEMTDRHQAPFSRPGESGYGFPLSFLHDYLSASEPSQAKMNRDFLITIATPYWTDRLNSRIDYALFRGGGKSGWWAKGFPIATAFMAAKASHIPIDYGIMANISEFTRYADTYTSNRIYSWHKVCNSETLPWNKEIPLDHLFAGLLLKICQDHEDEATLKKLYDALGQLPPLDKITNRAGARTNFGKAVAKATGKKDPDYYNQEIKWPLSSAQIKEALK